MGRGRAPRGAEGLSAGWWPHLEGGGPAPSAAMEHARPDPGMQKWCSVGAAAQHIWGSLASNLPLYGATVRPQCCPHGPSITHGPSVTWQTQMLREAHSDLSRTALLHQTHRTGAGVIGDGRQDPRQPLPAAMCPPCARRGLWSPWWQRGRAPACTLPSAEPLGPLTFTTPGRAPYRGTSRVCEPPPD